MRVVDPKELKNVYDTKEFGSFAKILKAELNKKLYCYRIFKNPYDLDIIENMAAMTDLEFEKEYLTALYMVGKIEKMRFNGCLTEWALKAQDLGLVCDRGLLLRYLRIGRNLVQNLHNKYQYIHGDISESNIIVNTDEDLVYICDFDSALRFDQEVKNTNYFSDLVYDYLNYKKFDKNVDVFCFNVMTLKLLLKLGENHHVFEVIESQESPLIEGNRDIKRLSKELLYYENRKPLSGEYIIDYLQT